MQLLRRRSSNVSARRVPIAPYFKVDFALQEGEDSGAFTVWTDILDQRLIAKLETVEKVHAVEEGVVITALIKECRGLAACIRASVSYTEHGTS